MHVTDKGHPLKALYRADLICFRDIIVENKAQRNVSPADEAQWSTT